MPSNKTNNKTNYIFEFETIQKICEEYNWKYYLIVIDKKILYIVLLF